MNSLTPHQLRERLRRGEPLVLLDVREDGEFAYCRIDGSRHVPLGELEQRLHTLPRGRRTVVHCQTGARAAIAASLLCARGVRDVVVFGGGFEAWRAAGHPIDAVG